jgi:hypothetical protein
MYRAFYGVPVDKATLSLFRFGFADRTRFHCVSAQQEMKMPLCGPVTYEPMPKADRPRVSVEIIGYFTTDQELAELLAKHAEARAAPQPDLQIHSLGFGK